MTDSMTSATGAALPATRMNWIRGLTIAELAGETLATIIIAPVLLVVAFWNGFPLIFYDTGAYLLEGLGHVFVPERAPVYSFLLRYSGAAESLWFVVCLQALITAFIVVETARADWPRLQTWRLIGIAAILCLVTGMPWYVGQVEPDCMTAIVVLSLYLLSFRLNRLGLGRGLLVGALAALAISVHPAHLALAGILIGGLVLLRAAAVLGRKSKLPRPNLWPSLASLAIALALVLASNHALTRRYFISRSGSVFTFARMLQDGLIQRLLDDTCPAAHFKMCAFKDRLPKRADAFLWDANSPFNKLERFHGPLGEYGTMIEQSIVRYPLANALAAGRETALQFIKIRTGDQIEPQEWIIYFDLAHYIPGQMNAYMEARQQQGLLRFETINVIHVTVAAVAMLVLLFVLAMLCVRREWDRAVLPAFVFLALFGNAFVCGVFSNPHDRYQSRLVWVPVFVLLLSERDRVLAYASRIRHLMRNG